MEWLKQGMKFIDEEGIERTVLEIGKSSTGTTTYVYERDSFGGTYAYFSEGIDWEETAKLNGIDLEEKSEFKLESMNKKEFENENLFVTKVFGNTSEKANKILEEVYLETEKNAEIFKNKQNISIQELKQKKEELKQNIYELLQKFEEETTVKVKSLELKDKIVDGYGYGDMKLRELLIELEV